MGFSESFRNHTETSWNNIPEIIYLALLKYKMGKS